LEGGNTVWEIVVTAQDGVAQETYTVTVARAASSNAKLASLTTSQPSYPLSPSWTPTTTSYTIAVGNSITTMKLRPVKDYTYGKLRSDGSDVAYSITVQGTDTVSGAWSPTLSGGAPLSEGGTTVLTVVVFAQDMATSQTYTVTVRRDPSTNAFLSSLTQWLPRRRSSSVAGYMKTRLTYTIPVPNDAFSIKFGYYKGYTYGVVPSTVQINGVTISSGLTESGTSGSITLSEGKATLVTALVTAQDATTTRTYEMTVNRAPSTNARLSSLFPSHGEVLVPAFSPERESYTMSVSNGVLTASLTATKQHTYGVVESEIKVNGVLLAASGVRLSEEIPLNEGGSTLLEVRVTAQDGLSQMKYKVTVSRAPSTNARLAGLVPSAGNLEPAFTIGRDSYILNAVNKLSKLAFTPTKDYTYGLVSSRITINGALVGSGHNSGSLPLLEGGNTTISILVTAQDGLTTAWYRVTVIRGPSNNAYLSSLSQSLGGIRGGSMDPTFATSRFVYTMRVAHNVAALRLVATTLHPQATMVLIQVNTGGSTNTLTSGRKTGLLPLKNSALSEASTRFQVEVTAQDRITRASYSLTVHRASAAQNKEAMLAVLGSLLGITMASFYISFVIKASTKKRPPSSHGEGESDSVGLAATDLTGLSLDHASQIDQNRVTGMAPVARSKSSRSSSDARDPLVAIDWSKMEQRNPKPSVKVTAAVSRRVGVAGLAPGP